MLRARGASVLLAPTVATETLDEEPLRRATDALFDGPVDFVVANTAIGMRAWIAAAWSWGMGDQLHGVLCSATVVARGAKAAGALLSEGVTVGWRSPDETLAGVRDHLLDTGVAGARVAVQLHGGDQAWFSRALRAAGADVLEMPVYRWVPPPSTKPIDDLEAAVAAGELDAITFTSPPAITGLLDDRDRLRETVLAGDIICACVGPVTAAAAVEAGLPNVVTAVPSRLGAMVRALSDRIAPRAIKMALDGRDVWLQGSLLTTSESEVRLTRLERTLLIALFESRGAVLSRARLAAIAWDGEVNDHAIVTAVNRLRRKLGPAATALETTSRRGYRLHVA